MCTSSDKDSKQRTPTVDVRAVGKRPVIANTSRKRAEAPDQVEGPSNIVGSWAGDLVAKHYQVLRLVDDDEENKDNSTTDLVHR